MASEIAEEMERLEPGTADLLTFRSSGGFHYLRKRIPSAHQYLPLVRRTTRSMEPSMKDTYPLLLRTIIQDISSKDRRVRMQRG